MADRHHSRIFKVVLQCPERDETFYTRMHLDNGCIVGSLTEIIHKRYPLLKDKMRSCFVFDNCGAKFRIICKEDFAVFIDGPELFENVIYVEMEGASRKDCPRQDAKHMHVHENVICDSCNKPIHGFRYKCAECNNYDLCMDCEKKMCHSQHLIVRFPTPKDSEHIQKILHSLRHITHPSGHEERHRGTGCNGGGAACGGGGGKKHHKRCSSRSLSRSRYAHDLLPCALDGVFHPINENPASDSSETTVENALGSDFQKLLKTVEKVATNVSKYFDPMGISIEGVMTTGQANNVSRSCNTSPVPVDCDEETPACPPTKAHDSAVSFKLCETDGAQEGPSSIKIGHGHKSVIHPTTDDCSDLLCGTDADWTLIGSKCSSTHSEKSPRPNSPTSTLGYSELARKLQKDIDAHLKKPERASNRQAVYHHNPKINDSVHDMIDMGFSNEGDFLTNLMVNCDGDIGRGLDKIINRF